MYIGKQEVEVLTKLITTVAVAIGYILMGLAMFNPDSRHTALIVPYEQYVGIVPCYVAGWFLLVAIVIAAFKK